MDCSNCNQNTQYFTRNGRNMPGGANFVRNNYQNTMQNRNGCNTINSSKTGCKNYDVGHEPVDKMSPTMAYVPWQKWEDVYCIEEGLEHGTIFAQLDKPFLGRAPK